MQNSQNLANLHQLNQNNDQSIFDRFDNSAQNTHKLETGIRNSQERGNQRVMSGFSKGSKGRGSAKSGKSLTSAGTGISAYQGMVQRGHIHQNSSLVNIENKKDSMNSNFSNINQNSQHFLRSSNSNMNMQQSQQVLSNHQGGALSASQRLESAMLTQNHIVEASNEIHEQDSQEESYELSPVQNSDISDKWRIKSGSGIVDRQRRIQKSKAQQSEDMKNLKEQMSKVPFNDSQVDLNNKDLQRHRKMPKDEHGAMKSTQDKQMRKKGSKLLGSQHDQSATQVGIVPLSYQKTMNMSTASGAHIGLEFLDVKKEIHNELKQIDKSAYQKLQKNQKSQLDLLKKDNSFDHKEKTMVVIQDSSVQDLRADHSYLKHIGDKQGQQPSYIFENYQENSSDNDPIQILSSTDNARKMFANMRSRSSSPIGRKQGIEQNFSQNQKSMLDIRERQTLKSKFGKRQRNTMNESKFGNSNNNISLLNKSNSNSRSNMYHHNNPHPNSLFTLKQSNSLENVDKNYGLQTFGGRQNAQSQANLQNLQKKATQSKIQLRKFIKSKQKEQNQKMIKERFEQLSQVVRLHENLSKLDNFVKKKFRKGSNDSKSSKKNQKSRERLRVQQNREDKTSKSKKLDKSQRNHHGQQASAGYDELVINRFEQRKRSNGEAQVISCDFGIFNNAALAQHNNSKSKKKSQSKGQKQQSINKQIKTKIEGYNINQVQESINIEQHGNQNHSQIMQNQQIQINEQRKVQIEDSNRRTVYRKEKIKEADKRKLDKNVRSHSFKRKNKKSRDTSKQRGRNTNYVALRNKNLTHKIDPDCFLIGSLDPKREFQNRSKSNKTIKSAKKSNSKSRDERERSLKALIEKFSHSLQASGASMKTYTKSKSKSDSPNQKSKSISNSKSKSRSRSKSNKVRKNKTIKLDNLYNQQKRNKQSLQQDISGYEKARKYSPVELKQGNKAKNQMKRQKNNTTLGQHSLDQFDKFKKQENLQDIFGEQYEYQAFDQQQNQFNQTRNNNLLQNKTQQQIKSSNLINTLDMRNQQQSNIPGYQPQNRQDNSHKQQQLIYTKFQKNNEQYLQNQQQLQQILNKINIAQNQVRKTQKKKKNEMVKEEHSVINIDDQSRVVQMPFQNQTKDVQPRFVEYKPITKTRKDQDKVPNMKSPQKSTKGPIKAQQNLQMFDQQLIQDQRHSDLKPQTSTSVQQRSSNRISRYSDEKWVEIKDSRPSDPIPFEINKGFSEMSQNQFSQKSLNNFTFFEKQTSKKDTGPMVANGQESGMFNNVNSQSQDTLAQIKLQNMQFHHTDMDMSSNSNRPSDLTSKQKYTETPSQQYQYAQRHINVISSGQQSDSGRLNMINSQMATGNKQISLVQSSMNKNFDMSKMQMHQNLDPTQFSYRSGHSKNSNVIPQFNDGQNAQDNIEGEFFVKRHAFTTNDSHRSTSSHKRTSELREIQNQNTYPKQFDPIYDQFQKTKYKTQQHQYDNVKLENIQKGLLNELNQLKQESSEENTVKQSSKVMEQTSSPTNEIYEMREENSEENGEDQIDLDQIDLHIQSADQELEQEEDEEEESADMADVRDMGMRDMLINQEQYQQQITIQVHSKRTTQSPDIEDTNEEISQKISQINIDKTIESKSIRNDTNDMNSMENLKQYHLSNDNSQNHFDQYKKCSLPQSLVSLNTINHNSQTSQISNVNKSSQSQVSSSKLPKYEALLKDPLSKQSGSHDAKFSQTLQLGGNPKKQESDEINDNDGDNGPTTLISHLNDPDQNNDDQMQVDINDPQIEINSKLSQKSFDANLKHPNQDSKSPKFSKLEDKPASQNQQRTVEGENLMKYLENQWNQKKMENSSSFFDHSRASALSDSKNIQRTSVASSDGQIAISHEQIQININQNVQQDPAIKFNPISEYQQKALDMTKPQQNEAAPSAAFTKNVEQSHAAGIIIDNQNVYMKDSQSASLEVGDGDSRTLAKQHSKKSDDIGSSGVPPENVHVIDDFDSIDLIPSTRKPIDLQLKKDDTSDELERYLDSEIQSNPISPDRNSQQQTITINDDVMQSIHQPENIQANSQRTPMEPTIPILGGRNENSDHDNSLQLASNMQNQLEMHITSNLTTLNMDGEGSSSDGFRGDSDNMQSGADMKCLNQFRKRQQQLQAHEKIQVKPHLDINQIEIQIEENSEPSSEDKKFFKTEQEIQHKLLEEHDMTPGQLNESLSNEVTPTLQQDIQHKQSISNGSTSTNNLVEKMIAANEPGQNIKISDILEKKRQSKKGAAAADEKTESNEQNNQICLQIVQEMIDSLDLEKQRQKQTTSTKPMITPSYDIITAESIMNKHKKFNEDIKNQKPKNNNRDFIDKLEHIDPTSSSGKPDKVADKEETKQLTAEQQESLFDVKAAEESQDKAEQEKRINDEDIQGYLQNSINQSELKNQIKQVISMKQRQSIENDLIRADDYVNELVQYLIQFEVPGLDEHDELLQELSGGVNFLTQFLTNLTQPIGRDLVVELGTLAKKEEGGSYAHFESCADPLKYPILLIDIYIHIEKQRELEYQQISQHLKRQHGYHTGNSAATVGSASVVQESQHILNKSIFDALNESLTKFRPYGTTGEPLPWSCKQRRLQTEVDINSVDTERLFQMVKQEVFRWMSIQQGAISQQQESIFQYIDLHVPLMPEIQEITKEQEKQESPNQEEEKEEKEQKPKKQTLEELKKMQESQIVKFKSTLVNDAISDLRQAKLANQLHQEIIEDEHHWLNYEFEETQIRVDLGDAIFNQVMDEACLFLYLRDNPGADVGESPLSKQVESVGTAKTTKEEDKLHSNSNEKSIRSMILNMSQMTNINTK